MLRGASATVRTSLSTRFLKKDKMQCAHKRVFCGQGMIPIITRGSRGENFQAVVAKIAPSTPTHWDLQSW